MITNRENNKKYIGQSNDIERRWSEHRTSHLNKNVSDYESKKNRAFRKYSIENFSLEVLELIEDDDLRNEREIYWIIKYDTVSNGYNTSNGGKGPNLSRENHSQSKLCESDIPVIVHDLKDTSMNFEVIAKRFDVSVATISLINTGQAWRIQSVDYPLRRKALARPGSKNGMSRISDEEALLMRSMYLTKTIPEIQTIFKDIIGASSVKHILEGSSYKHLPIYKKRKKMWI